MLQQQNFQAKVEESRIRLLVQAFAKVHDFHSSNQSLVQSPLDVDGRKILENKRSTLLLYHKDFTKVLFSLHLLNQQKNDF